MIVSIGVLRLRIRDPDLPLAFKTLAVWIVAPLGALSAMYLMRYLHIETWMRLLIWLAVGLVIYFAYSMHHSALNTKSPAPTTPPGTKP